PSPSAAPRPPGLAEPRAATSRVVQAKPSPFVKNPPPARSTLLRRQRSSQPRPARDPPTAVGRVSPQQGMWPVAPAERHRRGSGRDPDPVDPPDPVLPHGPRPSANDSHRHAHCRRTRGDPVIRYSPPTRAPLLALLLLALGRDA